MSSYRNFTHGQRRRLRTKVLLVDCLNVKFDLLVIIANHAKVEEVGNVFFFGAVDLFKAYSYFWIKYREKFKC